MTSMIDEGVGSARRGPRVTTSWVETATIRELIMVLARMEDATRVAVGAGALADVVELDESQRMVVAALRRHRGL